MDGLLVIGILQVIFIYQQNLNINYIFSLSLNSKNLVMIVTTICIGHYIVISLCKTQLNIKK